MLDAGISHEGVLALVDKFGGTRISVPKVPHSRPCEKVIAFYQAPKPLLEKYICLACGVVSCLQEADYQTLCRNYGGETLAIPRCHKVILAHRAQVILQARKAGTKISELARQYKMTERNINKIIVRAQESERLEQGQQPDTPQLDMLALLAGL
jgi:hypothetical protein